MSYLHHCPILLHQVPRGQRDQIIPCPHWLPHLAGHCFWPPIVLVRPLLRLKHLWLHYIPTDLYHVDPFPATLYPEEPNMARLHPAVDTTTATAMATTIAMATTTIMADAAIPAVATVAVSMAAPISQSLHRY